MERNIVVGGCMDPRRQSALKGDCENFTAGEFDALLATDIEPPEALRADELLEWIEDSDADVRFVPDWADTTFKNAA